MVKLISNKDKSLPHDITTKIFRIQERIDHNEPLEEYQKKMLSRSKSNGRMSKFKLLSVLDITMPREAMNEFYEKFFCIPLRPYDGEKTLVLGDGNREPYTGGEYGKFHKHEGEYTVSDNIYRNPSIIGHFGFKTLPIPNNSFEKIIIEIDSISYKFVTDKKYVEELIRLLKEGGKVYSVRGGNKPQLFPLLVKVSGVLKSLVGKETVYFKTNKDHYELLNIFYDYIEDYYNGEE